ncbi:type VII secretion protein EccB [soil metagenome]
MTNPSGPSQRDVTNPAGTSQRESGFRRAVARNWTTRIQVSGWRFMFHRLEHALVRRDTQMLHDPMRSTSRAMIVGVILAVLVGAGAVVMSFLSPQAKLNDADIVADKDTGALYVRINDGTNDLLHPVLNLPSAQLIIGSPKNPTFVKPAELATLPRGPLVGIVGAPERTPNPVAASEAKWSVCDDTTPAGETTVTVIGAPPTLSDAIGPLPAGSAILAGFGDQAFLIYDNKRTPINLEDKAVALAVGVDSSAPPVLPISRGLHDALEETPPLVVPAIAAAGSPSPWSLPASVVIGSIIKVRPVDGGEDAFYVVLTDGVERVSAVTAAIIRNADQRNPPPPIEVAPNAMLSIPTSRALNVDFYPDKPLKLIDPVAAPVTCLSWTQSRDETKPRTAVLTGRTLPLPTDAHPVSVVTADPAGGTASAVYIPPGTGQLVQIAGGSPTAATGESQWYIADTGVRYGLVTSGANPRDNPQVSLGITAQPLPAPWSIISLLPAGPALSKEDALISHDSLPADPRPGVVSTKANQAGG